MDLILVASGTVTGLLVGLTGVDHLLTGNVDFGLRGNLLLGSIPAAITGAMLSARLPHRLLRGKLLVILLSIGIKLLGTASV